VPNQRCQMDPWRPQINYRGCLWWIHPVEWTDIQLRDHSTSSWLSH
jgi:hypothetical protein